MTKENITESYDEEMEQILQKMVDEDIDITARAVIRKHSKINAASTITRNKNRKEILLKYQEKQSEYRLWRKRLSKRSHSSAAMDMTTKDLRIKELESQVDVLTASHLAMIRAVGELGGFSKWTQLFENHESIISKLEALKSLPDKIIDLPSDY